MQVTRNIVKTEDGKGFEVIINVKNGYSWKKTSLGFNINLLDMEISDNNGLIFRWKEI